jgi:hypothetical protein
MTCQLPNAADTPPNSPSNLAANRRADHTEFNYLRPGDVRADGFPLPPGSVKQIHLIARSVGAPGTYSTVDTKGHGGNPFKIEPPPPNNVVTIWSSQVDDNNDHRSLQSAVTITGLSEDADEPNGSRKGDDNTNLVLPAVSRPETYSPAGDQDFFAIEAKTGDVIDASATHSGALDGRNDPDYVMFLLDKEGNVVAFNDDSNGLNPRIVFTVPPKNDNEKKPKKQKFVVWVTDFYGSLLNSAGAPRIPSPLTYGLSVSVTPPAAPAGFLAAGTRPDEFAFANSGPNPANPISKFLFVIPQNQGPLNVRLRVYDVSGRLVRTLVNGAQNSGPHTAIWDGRDDLGRGVASGNYFARIEMGSFTKNMQVTILK